MGITVGSGEFRYELVESWPKMPKYWEFGGASDVAVNSIDEIHVFSRGDHPLTIWDTDGNFVSSWGEGSFSDNEHGIFIAPNDQVWLVDANYHIVTKHSPYGELLMTLGNKLTPSPTFIGRPFNMPTGLSIAPNGNIWVSDGYGGHRVHKFNPQGKILHSFGAQGDGPSQFALLHNIGVDKRERVYVCDRENNRIQVFDDQGNYLDQWTDLILPGDLWLVDGVVYVIEQGDEEGVSIWNLDGEILTRWRGSASQEGRTIQNGHGICVDSEGSIYVAELSPRDCVTKFQRL